MILGTPFLPFGFQPVPGSPRGLVDSHAEGTWRGAWTTRVLTQPMDELLSLEMWFSVYRGQDSANDDLMDENI